MTQRKRTARKADEPKAKSTAKGKRLLANLKDSMPKAGKHVRFIYHMPVEQREDLIATREAHRAGELDPLWTGAAIYDRAKSLGYDIPVVKDTFVRWFNEQA